MLDVATELKLLEISEQLASEFGIPVDKRNSSPHLTFLVFSDFDDELEDSLETLSDSLDPVDLFSGGYSLIMRPDGGCTVARSLVRDPVVNDMHCAISEAVEGQVRGISTFTQSQLWQPHFTLIQRLAFSSAGLDALYFLLSKFPGSWHSSVNGLGFVEHSQAGHSLRWERKFCRKW